MALPTTNQSMTQAVRQSVDLQRYALVTAAYWGLTLTDGALRMLVLLHFHELGCTPLQLAGLFLLYEVMGIFTNLFGGYLAANKGLKITLFSGLGTQVLALLMLSTLGPDWAIPVSVAYVMASQALSGVAKDLTKMSSKSAVKLILPPPPPEEEGKSAAQQDSQLFKWVAILTGSKNALKGVGFFMGGFLLTVLGFQGALWAMAGGLAVILAVMFATIKGDFGKTRHKPKFAELFSKSKAINLLSFARIFLFAARDVWFVVALPVFLYDALGWSFTSIGAFMAGWVIAYGFVQAAAPSVFKNKKASAASRSAMLWGLALALIPAVITVLLQADFYPTAAVLIGLGVFGVFFAINSSVHSYLILALTDHDQVALNVGFYYMANAIGRLLGTLLSGLVYMTSGLSGCLWVSAGMVLIAAVSLAPLGRHSMTAAVSNPA